MRLFSSRAVRMPLLALRLGTITVAAFPILVHVWRGPVVRAQTSPERPDTYEVVSIKTAPDRALNNFHVVRGGVLRVEAATLHTLISYAYEIGCVPECGKYISGGPAWADKQRFQILAKPARPDQSPDLRLLLRLASPRIQALLEDRFQLRIRREAKEMPVYTLNVIKSGHKMKKEDDADRPGSISAPGYVIGNNMSIASLGRILSRSAGRPVLDSTGLTGAFHVELMYDPASIGSAQPAAKLDPKGGTVVPSGPNEPERPSLFKALREQLGLELKATRGPVETIFIEHVAWPTEN